MLLITEQNFNDVGYSLVESASEKEPPKMYIEGIFLQSNRKNRNGRIYEDKILRPVIEKYVNEQVKTGRAGGELNHPQRITVDPERVSHRITELNWNGDDVYGKALVLNTPTGNIVRGLIEGGFSLGVSSRGMGSLERRGDVNYVKDDFMISTIDVVADPSAPDAFVNGILEGVEFIFSNDGKLIQKNAEQFEEIAEQRIKEKSIPSPLSESDQLKRLQQFFATF